MTTRLAIVNPEAGNGRCGRMATGAISALRQQGVNMEVWYTRSAGHATKLARQGYAQGFREFVAVGGDGTSFEIVNGLSEVLGDNAQEIPAVVPLPLGTGNSFVRDFAVENADDMLGRIVAGNRRRCDVLRLVHDQGELLFLNILSFGYVADVCSSAKGPLRRFGALGYGAAVVGQLSSLGSVAVDMSLDDTTAWRQDALVLAINNSQFTGGAMRIAPFADTADGFADILLVGEMSKPAFVKLFSKIFSGDHVHHPSVTTARARTIEFNNSIVQGVMVDGEVRTLRPLRVEVIPSAIEIVV